VQLTINGEQRVLRDGLTLADLLRREASQSRGCAAAVNGEVVPRADWAAFVLRAGQAVEILTAVQGG